MRKTGLVEIKQAISYTHRDPLYHIPGSSVVYCTATLYVSPTKLCLFPYLPASLCHYVRMSIQIILHHSLPLSPWSRQAAKLIKTRGQEFHCVLGLMAFHDALHAHAEDYKSN